MMQTQSTQYSEYPTKLSSRNQTVVPSRVRKALGLKKGSRLYWRIMKIGRELKAIADPKPIDWAAFSRGLGKESWKGIDVDEYIRKLREEW